MTTKTRRPPKAGEGKSLLDLDALAKTPTAATPPVPTSDAPVDTAPETGQEPAQSPNGTAAMVALFPDPDVAAALAQDGGQDPATLHITLLYLGDDSTSLDRAAVEAAVSSVAAVYGPVQGELNGLCVFNPTGRDEDQGMPLVATLDAPGLSSLREAIANEVREAAQIPPDTHGFCPHMTLAYLPSAADTAPDAEGGDEAGMPPMSAPPATPITFSDLVVAWPDTQTRIPLTGTFDAAGSGIEEAIEAMPDDATAPDEPEEIPAPDAVAPAPAMGLATDAPAVSAPPTEPIPGPDAVPDEGRVIPTPGPLGMWEACLVTEGEATDEVFLVDEGAEVRGRFIANGLAQWRTPPIPGGFAMDDMGNPADNGHEKAPVACTALEMVREGNRIMARGPYLDNVAGAALKAAVDGGAPIGPSISFVGDVWDITTDASGKTMQTLLEGSIAGFVVLPYEAQHSTQSGEWLTWFRSVPDAEVPAPETMPAEVPAVVPIAASAVVADGAPLFGAPLYPPRRMLEHPPPESPGAYTGLTIVDAGEDKGHVFGAVAGGTCHLSFPGTCVRITDKNMARDFAVFHKGLPSAGRGIKTAEGDFVGVGQITMAAGHADITASATEARTFYDNTGAVIANGTIVWSDALGVPWFSGCLVPGATEAQVQALRACGEVSVDYRQLEDGRLHLVHLLAVPRGGFPPMRALSAAGDIRTLILAPDAGKFAVTGAADLPIAPRDTEWDGAGASQRVARLCRPEGDTLDPSCFARAFFYRDEAEPDTNIGSYSLPFADVINGKLQAVYAGVAAGAARLDQTDIPADAKDQIKGRMSAYYKRFTEAFSDPTITAPWETAASAVAADGVLLALEQDLYARKLGEVASVLASAHQREAERLGALVR